MKRLAIVALFAALALQACQPTISPSAPIAPPGSPIVGVVTNVVSGGLNEVSSFELRTDEGTTYAFEIGDLENAAEFPPGHLREHMATSSPVRVTFEVNGDRLLVTRLEEGQ
ncbi:MAG: hypothetical protein L0221_18755 [Chloroflexi bacterium]|nr:hypothetical protein [Chloroflexota bacterium]